MFRILPSRKGEPFLGKPFTVKKTVQRHATLIIILARAAKRPTKAANDETAHAYHRLVAPMSWSYYENLVDRTKTAMTVRVEDGIIAEA